MKLEELTSITTLLNDAVIYDCYGSIVAKCTLTDGIPAFLNDVEIDSIHVGQNGELHITLQYENPMKPAEYIKSVLADLDEAVADDYRMSSPEDVKQAVKSSFERICNESSYILQALDENREWDYYLD